MELFAGRAVLSEAVREAGGFIVISSDSYTVAGEGLRDPDVLARVLDRGKRRLLGTLGSGVSYIIASKQGRMPR